LILTSTLSLRCGRNIRIRLPTECPHYTTTDLNIYITRFSELCQEVGLSIKESKNEEGTIASFGGIEIDTENMVIRLPENKLLKAQQLVQNAIEQTSLSLLEQQKLTGYVNFVATVDAPSFGACIICNSTFRQSEATTLDENQARPRETSHGGRKY